MNTKHLRQKILDLAIRGKLIPQDPNDEPASVLLERVRAEKERLIKEGKIKRDKKDSAVLCGDKSHYEQLPDGWALTSFSGISINRDGERIPVSSAIRKGLDKIYDYYGASGIIDKIDKYIFDDELLLIGEDGANLLTRSKPIAFIATGKYWVNNHAHVIDAVDKITLKWLCYFINAIDLSPFVTGSAQPKITQDNLNSINVYLPPLAEQHRIVAAIESVFALIDEIEHNKADLHATVTAAKSKILSLAIRGKLVPQDPNDEPASVLLERIRAECEMLIKAGKIKRRKNETATAQFCDNSYYDGLPESWISCRLGAISKMIQYGLSNSAEASGNYRLLRITDIQENHVEWNSVPYTNIDEKQAVEFALDENDIVFARTGATVGKSYLIKSLPVQSVFASYLIRVKTIAVNPQYIKFYFDSSQYWEQIIDKSVGIGQPNVNGTKLQELVIPLPPLAEQKRIVIAIEAALEQLDSISAMLA